MNDLGNGLPVIILPSERLHPERNRRVSDSPTGHFFEFVDFIFEAVVPRIGGGGPLVGNGTSRQVAVW